LNPVREWIAARRELVLGSAVIALALALLLALAGRAQAAELVYWDNYTANPDSVSVANLDGSGGGTLPLTGAEIDSPEGMAFDSVTGRLFVSNAVGEHGQITFVNVDGSGAGVFTAPGAPIEEPEGVAVDPVTRMIYWTNTEGNGAAEGSIAWAKLDGSAGGMLNTTGATLEEPYKIAIDTVHNRVYWSNEKTDGISFANADNTGGGGNLDLTGATPPEYIDGLSVDPAGGRIYWLDESGEHVSFASLSGGGGGDVNITGAPFNSPFGLAFDPALGRLYWGNYNGGSENPENAIGFADLSGSVGGISPATAEVAGPQDPVILKSPTGTAAPVVTRSKNSRASLACSAGEWAADYAGSFVYQAPKTLAYQWTRNGQPIAGATATTFVAKSAGTYGCTVTATNQAGSASQSSAAANVKAAKLKLSAKKAKAKAGGLATFKVKVVNQGDLKSKKAKICAKVPKKAKSDLKAKKCSKVPPLGGRKKKTVKVKLKVLPSADGSYKLTFKPKGVPGKAAKGKLIVH
jgi:hypothetical protein